jgi:hypothetical protein
MDLRDISFYNGTCVKLRYKLNSSLYIIFNIIDAVSLKSLRGCFALSFIIVGVGNLDAYLDY